MFDIKLSTSGDGMIRAPFNRSNIIQVNTMHGVRFYIQITVACKINRCSYISVYGGSYLSLQLSKTIIRSFHFAFLRTHEIKKTIFSRRFGQHNIASPGYNLHPFFLYDIPCNQTSVCHKHVYNVN